jgi:hypothetical protein
MMNPGCPDTEKGMVILDVVKHEEIGVGFMEILEPNASLA